MNSPMYRNFEDFEREEIRPGMRAGWSLDNINDPSRFENDFDQDPFEAALDAAELEDADDDYDDDE